MVMGIVRRGCLKSIVWHESGRLIDVGQAPETPESRRASAAASRGAAIVKPVGSHRDEPPRARRQHPADKLAYEACRYSRRPPRVFPVPLRQNGGRDPKQPTARATQQGEARHPADEIGHRLDDCGLWRRHLERSARRRQTFLLPRRREQVGAYLAPLLRHSLARKRLRHSDSPGIAGPQRCEHNDDLHPCAKSQWARSDESGRSNGWGSFTG